jgi:hypothetical protein
MLNCENWPVDNHIAPGSASNAGEDRSASGKELGPMADGMTPEEYARFMGMGDDDEGPSQSSDDKDDISENEIDRIRMGLKQSGVSADNVDKVMAKVPTLKKGDMLEFNFIRGHVRRVRLRRETSGKITLITY